MAPAGGIHAPPGTCSSFNLKGDNFIYDVDTCGSIHEVLDGDYHFHSKGDNFIYHVDSCGSVHEGLDGVYLLVIEGFIFSGKWLRPYISVISDFFLFKI